MSRMIEFKYPCQACRKVSKHAGRKPTLITPTVGWVSCPECECKFQLQLTFVNKKRPDGVPGPALQIAMIDWKQSQKHADRIAQQKERDAKKAASVAT